MTTFFVRLIGLMALSVAAATAATAKAAAPAPSPGPSHRYTFSWPLNGGGPAPRGGMTRGPTVTLDTSPSPAWRALHAPGLSAFERDRRAILALAGEHRVTFDFLEIASFRPDGERDRPYQSWGTERIYVDQDRGTFISLVHILEMQVIEKDGSVSKPFVQRHWRQDWQYEPTQLIRFEGYDRWQRRTLTASERRGQWSETIDQVDDSPRYAALGHWEHTADFSTWTGGQTWRPLPVRELVVHRKDYQALIGTDRITIVPTGWLQEENNLKAVLTPNRELAPSHPYLAREYGVARYEQLRDVDFTEATRYFERTQAFWDQVHAAWADVFRNNSQVTLHARRVRHDGQHLTLSDYADQLAAGHAPKETASDFIRSALRDVGAPALPVDPEQHH